MGRMTGRNTILLVAILASLAGCGGAGGGNRGESGENGGAAAVATGLYESPAGERRDQLCVIERDGGAAAFGFIVWGRGDSNCSGSGTMRRDGERLRLLLDNDASCVIEARAEANGVHMTGGLSAECARYYCGGGASLDGAAFAKAADGREAAARARDLAGETLCAG